MLNYDDLKSFVSTGITSLDVNCYNPLLRSVLENQNPTYILEDDSDSDELVGFAGNEDKCESIGNESSEDSGEDSDEDNYDQSGKDSGNQSSEDGFENDYVMPHSLKKITIQLQELRRSKRLKAK